MSIFATVKPGEGSTAFLLMLNVFTLLTAYYIIKPVREALILSGSGAEIKSYAGAGQAMLCSMLETGEWKIAGNELIVKVAASAGLIEMSVSSEARRMMIGAASGALGRAVKLQILPGATPHAVPPRTPPTNGSSRGRAEQEPVVQRMKEKFGAEIRTIIDYRKNDDRKSK